VRPPSLSRRRAATDFRSRILDKQPVTLHQRTPLLIGSRDEVERVMEFCRE